MKLIELALRSCNPFFSKVFQTCLQVILCKKIFHHGHFFPTFVGPTTDLEEEYEPDEGLDAPSIPLPIPNITGRVAGRYPTRSRRSVLGNLPYDRYLQFLQTSKMLNDVKHEQDSELITQSEDEMAVMKYLLTKYILKAGLKHFGEKWIAAAKGEITQLHVMDT